MASSTHSYAVVTWELLKLSSPGLCPRLLVSLSGAEWMRLANWGRLCNLGTGCVHSDCQATDGQSRLFQPSVKPALSAPLSPRALRGRW